MPRALRARLVKQVGEQINLVIPFLVSLPSCISVILKVVWADNDAWPSPTDQGKPKPVVCWLKDGQPLDTKRVNIRNSDKDSILFIRASQREDSGVYEISVKVDSFEDKATITLQIVGEQPLHMLSFKQAQMQLYVHDNAELWSLLGQETSLLLTQSSLVLISFQSYLVLLSL